jgi:hypothetical protein
MDEGLTRLHATQSGEADTDALIAEARAFAIDLLRPYMATLWPLAQVLAVRGYATPDDIAQACR